MNSTVPIASEVFKAAGVYDANRFVEFSLYLVIKLLVYTTAHLRIIKDSLKSRSDLCLALSIITVVHYYN